MAKASLNMMTRTSAQVVMMIVIMILKLKLKLFLVVCLDILPLNLTQQNMIPSTVFHPLPLLLHYPLLHSPFLTIFYPFYLSIIFFYIPSLLPFAYSFFSFIPFYIPFFLPFFCPFAYFSSPSSFSSLHHSPSIIGLCQEQNLHDCCWHRMDQRWKTHRPCREASWKTQLSGTFQLYFLLTHTHTHTLTHTSTCTRASK